MIFFDSTKTGRQGHRSGLMRVSERLSRALGEAATQVVWNRWDRSGLSRQDWFVTAELFSETERPGFWDFLRSRLCRTAAIFHDAIPLKHPAITWPQSIARHPEYMKMLASFDRVWAVSQASRDELLGFWRWQGIENPPQVDVLALGADFNEAPRATRPPTTPPTPPALLCVGILEPRKNQTLLLDVCPLLWDEGLAFELHFAGRVNPHFGKPIAQRLRTLGRKYPQLHYHEDLGDQTLAALYSSLRATVFPTLAEGCGLPLLESLWRGVPCVCSDLPVLMENARGGACLATPANDPSAWQNALRLIVSDDSLWQRLASEAAQRPLPTWAEAAATIRTSLSA
ncbi:MAG: glycosyltransferase [Opitutaceae bacterium]|jgi:glycosyltransferase involved in cell wall biosynthesis